MKSSSNHAESKSKPRHTGKTVHPLLSTMNPRVFFTSGALIILFSLYGSLFHEHAAVTFQTIQNFFIGTFGWFYMLVVSFFFLMILGLAIMPSGRIRLGPDNSTPDYKYSSWFAMLFSAGMGIGLMYFGVAEPMMHYASPPAGDGYSVNAARESMQITMFHWGFHAWAIYIIVGLSLAYFVYRHDLPMTVRSALYPIFKERIHGRIGDTIDIFALLSTMFGVATSLGIGVMQVNAGLNYLFNVEITTAVQVGLIAGITLLATVSVVSGLDKGIRRISEFNLFLAFGLLLFVLIAGPTVSLLNALIQNIGMYLSSFVGMSFQLYAYEPTTWMGSWTLFYWAWWISWAPFVGMFIARISRGRTIREFITGVMLVPTGFTFMWFTFFGNGALFLEMSEGTRVISDAVSSNMPTAVFAYLQQLPLASLTSLLATLLVITFFVTSSDSGSLVIDMISSGGAKNPPTWQRVFWASTEGLVAAVLLVAGGLSALQTAAITSALPFALIMLMICYSLFRALRVDVADTEERLRMAQAASVHTINPTSEAGLSAGLPSSGSALPETLPPETLPSLGSALPETSHWKLRLRSVLGFHQKSELQAYIKRTVRPALRNVSMYAKEIGLQTDLKLGRSANRLQIQFPDSVPFSYEVRLETYSAPSLAGIGLVKNGGDKGGLPSTQTDVAHQSAKVNQAPAAQQLDHAQKQRPLFYRAEVYLMGKPQDYDVAGFTEHQLANDILERLEDFVQDNAEGAQSESGF